MGVEITMKPIDPDHSAAGDAVAGLKQISVAIGHAVIAATAIHNRLRELTRISGHADGHAAVMAVQPPVRSGEAGTRML